MIPAARDIVQYGRVRVQRRVDETDGTLAAVGALFVDQGDDGAKGRGRGRGAVDEAQGAIDRDDVVGAIGGDVWVAAYSPGIVVLGGGVCRPVVGKVGAHSRGLVRGFGEDVTEATP